MNRDAVNRDAVNRDAVNRGAVNRGAVNRGAVNRGAVNRGAVNSGAVNRGAVNSGAMNRRAMNSGAMLLYPAIDLRDGRCVRLYQGDYDRQTTYGDDPVAQARAFASEGAEVLHVVDLDAARSGQPTNRPVIGAICQVLDVPVQVGGGVRSEEAAQALFDLGVDRVVIGTAAIEDPDLVTRLVDRGRRIVVGLDARGDSVATHGWTTDAGQTVEELAARFSAAGVAALVVTEISRDGTLGGPDVAGLSRLLATTDIPVIASGGVGTVEDLTTLAGIAVDGRRLAGAIVGRALYEGKFSVSEALRALDETVIE